jgi:Integrase zinc binding domain
VVSDSFAIGYRNSGGVVGISDDKLIQLRLKIAHAGPGGHRGISSTTFATVDLVWWRSIGKDVKSFGSSCLLCLSATIAGRIPRPTDQTLTRPNQTYCSILIQWGASCAGITSRWCRTIILLVSDRFWCLRRTWKRLSGLRGTGFRHSAFCGTG